MGRVEYAILQSTQIFALKTHPSHAQYDCNDINPTEDDTKTIRSIQMEHQNGQAGKSWKLSTFPAKQCIQNRGLIVIRTKDYGKVAVLPIGMAQVSSVVMTVKKGDHVKKGDNISYFQFGGSDVVVVFEKKVTFKSGLKPGETKLNVRSELARFQ